MNDFEARQAARVERYRERAARACFSSPANETLRAMQGEPVKIGHHSERRHRRLIEKADRDMSKGCEELSRAEYWERRARAAEGNAAVSGRDPEAVEKLLDKLNELGEAQDRMKTVNEAHRRFLADPATLDAAPLTDADKALVRAYKPAYSWEPHPFPPYALKNNNANMRRVRERIEELERQRAEGERPDRTGEAGGVSVVVRDNAEMDATELHFAAKPPPEVLAQLKARGWHWVRSAGYWSRRRSSQTDYLVGELLKAAQA